MTKFGSRNDEDEELALDAAEFWLTLSEDDACVEALGPYLNKIVPCLLESMVYSEEDVMRLEGERDDAEEEDRDQDIKPTFAASKTGRNAQDSANGDQPGQKTNGPTAADDDELTLLRFV